MQYYARLLVQLGADPKAVMGLVENTIGGQVLPDHSSEEVCAEAAGQTEAVPTVADVEHPSEHVVEPGPTPVQQTSDSVVQSDVGEPKAKSAGTGPERRRQRIAHGVLGFRIRAIENSTIKDRAGTPPSPARPTVKSTAKTPKKTSHPSSRSHPSKPG